MATPMWGVLAGLLFAWQNRDPKTLADTALATVISKVFPAPAAGNPLTAAGQSISVQISQGELPSPDNSICFLLANVPFTKTVTNIAGAIANLPGCGSLTASAYSLYSTTSL